MTNEYDGERIMAGELQKNCLETICKSGNSVTVFLLNGIKLQGIITGFDEEVILLRRDNVVQVLYKHAVSTVMAGNLLPEIENY